LAVYLLALLVVLTLLLPYFKFVKKY